MGCLSPEHKKLHKHAPLKRAVLQPTAGIPLRAARNPAPTVEVRSPHTLSHRASCFISDLDPSPPFAELLVTSVNLGPASLCHSRADSNHQSSQTGSAPNTCRRRRLQEHQENNRCCCWGGRGARPITKQAPSPPMREHAGLWSPLCPLAKPQCSSPGWKLSCWLGEPRRSWQLDALGHLGSCCQPKCTLQRAYLTLLRGRDVGEDSWVLARPPGAFLVGEERTWYLVEPPLQHTQAALQAELPAPMGCGKLTQTKGERQL